MSESHSATDGDGTCSSVTHCTSKKPPWHQSTGFPRGTRLITPNASRNVLFLPIKWVSYWFCPIVQVHLNWRAAHAWVMLVLNVELL